MKNTSNNILKLLNVKVNQPFTINALKNNLYRINENDELEFNVANTNIWRLSSVYTVVDLLTGMIKIHERMPF